MKKPCQYPRTSYRMRQSSPSRSPLAEVKHTSSKINLCSRTPLRMFASVMQDIMMSDPTMYP
jgi:hypothetical protein